MARKVIQVSSQYTDKQGAKKWRNVNVGSAFVYDNGDIKLMIDPGVSISCPEGVSVTLKEPLPPREGGGGY